MLGTTPDKPQQPYPIFLLLRLIKVPIYYYIYTSIVPAIFAETVVKYLPSDVSPTKQIIFRRLIFS